MLFPRGADEFPPTCPRQKLKKIVEGSIENLTSQRYSNYHFLFLLVEHDWSYCVRLEYVSFSMKLYAPRTAGRRKRTRDLFFISPSHGPLRFVNSLCEMPSA